MVAASVAELGAAVVIDPTQIDFVARYGETLVEFGAFRIHRSVVGLVRVFVAAAVVFGAGMVIGDARPINWVPILAMTVWLFATGVLHEAAHAVVARRVGERVDGFGWRAGGFYVVYSSPTGGRTPRASFLIAVAGPTANAVSISAFIIGMFATESGSVLWVSFAMCALLDAVLVVSNLIPIAGSDGRKLRQALSAARNTEGRLASR